jgi:site-specific DNA-methyltransferase (adenine-specific)
LLNSDEFAREAVAEDVEDIPENPTTKAGDIWILGRHRVICADCTEIDNIGKILEGKKADLLWTDPPYGISYTEKSEEIAKASGRKIKNHKPIANDDLELPELKKLWKQALKNCSKFCRDGAVYYISSPQGGDLMHNLSEAIQNAGFLLKHQLIWVKNQQVLGRCDYHYRHEPIFYGWKGGDKHLWNAGRNKNSILEYDRPQKSDMHPTMKPVELVKECIFNSSNRDDIILDPFLGSGTTLIASEISKRQCFGLELDPGYCDIIVKRWQDISGQEAYLSGTKKSFATIESERK